jgi:predicted porin
MKIISQKIGLAFAASASLISLPCAAQSSVTPYGEVRLTLNQIKTGSASAVTELRDNASRLGFRGVEDLGGGLQALFGLEMGLSADSGIVGDPAFRNSYVALRGSLGTVAMGRLDSANPTGSPLYSQITKLTSFAPNDSGATATSASMLNSRNRTSNSVGYASPTFGGASLRARTYLRGAGTVAEAEDAARSVDIGVNYEAGALSAGFGMGRDTRSGGLKNNEFEDKWQAGMNYKFSPFDVYLVGGVDHYKNTANTRGDVKFGLLGGSYRNGPHKVVLNFLRRDVQGSLTGVRNRQQLSYQYYLSKRTELQFFIDNDGVDSSKSNVRVQAVGTGIRHNF